MYVRDSDLFFYSFALAISQGKYMNEKDSKERSNS